MPKERVAPEPHRYATCAPAGISIKEYYRGTFEEVFIFFHPFEKPIEDESNIMLRTYGDIKHYEKITWEQFLKISGLKSIKQLDIGLRTTIFGLRKEYADRHAGSIIKDTCERENILDPSEGVFPD